MSEVVFIGTSPINLLKGYLISKAKPESRITFIDQYNRFGGAWYSDTSEKGYEIECGCHIWTYNPEVYAYFKNELGLNMEVMAPLPVFKYGKTNLSYPLYTIKDSYTYIVKNLLTLKLGNVRAINESPQYYWKIFGKKNQYPKEGSPILIRTLKDLLDKNPRVEFKLSTAVEEVDISEKITLIGPDLRLKCDEIFLTSVSDIKKFVTKNETINVKHSVREYIHILVKTDKKPLKKASYHRLINDNIIHRVTDISYQTNDEEHLFLVGINATAYHSNKIDQLMDYFRKYLLNQNIISSEFVITFVKDHTFPTHYIDEEQRNQIKALDERIVLQYSTDLMYGFYYILKEHGLIR